MARGIKKSGGSINTLYYHTWPASGSSSIEGADWYIPGVGSDALANATHVDVTTNELSDLVPVYLEDENAGTAYWHKSSDLSDTAISTISSDETDDIDLYAKWIYNVYEDNINFEVNDRPQSGILLSSDDVIFRWGGD